MSSGSVQQNGKGLLDGQGPQGPQLEKRVCGNSRGRRKRGKSRSSAFTRLLERAEEKERIIQECGASTGSVRGI